VTDAEAMATSVMLTRVSPAAAADPGQWVALGDRVAARLKVACPEVRWRASYAVLGPHDYVDVFEAPDTETAARAVRIDLGLETLRDEEPHTERVNAEGDGDDPRAGEDGAGHCPGRRSRL
jgi:uncharacterized protein with GYD domain